MPYIPTDFLSLLEKYNRTGDMSVLKHFMERFCAEMDVMEPAHIRFVCDKFFQYTGWSLTHEKS